ncbi:MAG: primase-helicase zinc-binding domain-containing protein [Thiobacillus sp.]|nr:primase-helicase zinc-binding domain-containing protein [Thiobacillus sp.]
MRPRISEVAQGRWPGILSSFGLTGKQLSGKHTACPVCGGQDRFRFDDKEGRGTFFCSHCGAGDGVQLVMSLKGVDFRTAAQEIESIAGVVEQAQVAKLPDEKQKLEALRRVWAESKPLAIGDEVMRYLAGRGLDLSTPPDNLRLHPAMPYHDGEKFVGKFQAMVALVHAPDGTGVTLHRTFLKDGRKAPVECPRKLMPGRPIAGAAIRLSRVGEGVGIAEGIETALAASIQFGIPVWSCVTAHGIETFEPPAGVKRITIFADNDASFTGQKAAYTAAFRLVQQGFDVEVKVPAAVGDWLDVLPGARTGTTETDTGRIKTNKGYR